MLVNVAGYFCFVFGGVITCDSERSRQLANARSALRVLNVRQRMYILTRNSPVTFIQWFGSHEHRWTRSTSRWNLRYAPTGRRQLSPVVVQAGRNFHPAILPGGPVPSSRSSSGGKAHFFSTISSRLSSQYERFQSAGRGGSHRKLSCLCPLFSGIVVHSFGW